MADFNVFVWGPEGTEDTADTLRALHIVSKMSEYAIDTFRPKHLAILCDADPKLGQNLVKIPIRSGFSSFITRS